MAKHEYRILSRRTKGGLAAIGEEFLNDGWQLVGGVSVRTEKEYVQAQELYPVVEEVVKFYQAITRSKDSRPVAHIHFEDTKEVVNLYSEN